MSPIQRAAQNILTKPDTKRLSLVRLVFVLSFAISAYMTITSGDIPPRLSTFTMALLPYLYFDKKMQEHDAPAQQ